MDADDAALRRHVLEIVRDDAWVARIEEQVRRYGPQGEAMLGR
jgi:hypothetical protein